MLITRPTISALQIRAGRGYDTSRPADRLLYTDALDEDSKVPAMPLVQSIDFPSKGKHKGLVLVKVEGKTDPIPFERDAQVIVERQVADEQERADYLAKADVYYRVDTIVRLRQRLDDAVASLISRAEDVREQAQPRLPFGGSVLGREAGDVESLAGQYEVTLRYEHEALAAAGITPEQIHEWAKDRSLTSRGHSHLRPQEPVNGDCDRNGLPVPNERGMWTCAPLDAPEPAEVS